MSALLQHGKTKLLPKKEQQQAPMRQGPYLEALAELNENDSLVEEPPAWHEAIAEQRYKEWMEGKVESRSLEEVFKELKAELGIK